MAKKHVGRLEIWGTTLEWRHNFEEQCNTARGTAPARSLVTRNTNGT
eukprot:CAMPEP_0174364640 /NCGR_PEP_ID=MMETSP0811_2-20130205/73779_1 /TAXON_ID=73025 ORGANISM="Eutreptiella gymnastica-like, Strain CCMP1594" /NCGR_SAMPLE_ID=MMETSP0811_2 /ASSEMBLY_ACC=CAM_ASM_000667 /LENGTH=46 /DNA_ID= /DNA_START= /DNA_END= /DNA_ORIENTATION=